MISIEELNRFSDETLVNLYKTLNYWIWSPLLGEEPEEWNEMPNYRKPHMGECATKEDIIRPYKNLLKSKFLF